MPFYRDHIYPRLVSWLSDPEPVHEIRRRLIPQAQGTVLEIGVGSGVNFNLYDLDRITKIYALEPNATMVRLSRQHCRLGLNVEHLELTGEQIPLQARSIDTVVSTFTLCTIPGVVDAIRGIRRVLKSDGKLIFLEHGLSPDSEIQRWQRRCEPFTRWLCEGCHVTRDIPALLRGGGFQIRGLETGYVAIPKFWTYCFWGSATPTQS
jgi:SAM-dependent methyltransferase